MADMLWWTLVQFADHAGYAAAKKDLEQDDDVSILRAIWSGGGLPPIRALIQHGESAWLRVEQIVEQYGGTCQRRSAHNRAYVEGGLRDERGRAVLDVDDEPVEAIPETTAEPPLVDLLREVAAQAPQPDKLLFLRAADALEALTAELRDLSRERDALVYAERTVAVHLAKPGDQRIIERVTVGGVTLEGVVDASIFASVKKRGTLEVTIARFEVEPYKERLSEFVRGARPTSVTVDEFSGDAAERLARDMADAAQNGIHQLEAIEVENDGVNHHAVCSCGWTSEAFRTREIAFADHQRHIASSRGR